MQQIADATGGIHFNVPGNESVSNYEADLDAINESGDYNDEIEAKLKAICDAFAEKGAY